VRGPLSNVCKRPVVLGAAILADAQEDDAVDGLLHGEVEVADGQAGIAQGEVAGQQVAPALDLGQESVVHRARAAFALGGVGVFVEGAAQDGIARKDRRRSRPIFNILVEGVVEDAGLGGPVGLFGFYAGVVNGQLLEVGEDAERQLGGPAVAPELVGRGNVALDVDRGLLGLDEELAGTADAETVIGRLGITADADGILVDDVLVGVGIARFVIHVPAQGGKERI
jgi:hypothetical protein